MSRSMAKERKQLDEHLTVCTLHHTHRARYYSKGRGRNMLCHDVACFEDSDPCRDLGVHATKECMSRLPFMSKRLIDRFNGIMSSSISDPARRLAFGNRFKTFNAGL
eukprot:scaffold4199_cov101-Cylindrotheca_fusiformis.AAC.3